MLIDQVPGRCRVSYQLERVTDRKKIRGFERSIAWDKEPCRKVIELWQCAVCRCYWEYICEEDRSRRFG